MTDNLNPNAAIDAVASIDKRLAPRMRWPLWRHAAFGLLESLIVLGVSLPVPTGIACIVVAMGGLAWIVADDKKRHGMFVSGWQNGRTRWVTIGLTMIIVALLIVSMSRSGQPAPDPIAISATIAAFVVATAGSLLWQRVFQRQLASAEN